MKGNTTRRPRFFGRQGACLFIRREVYLKAGGLDESFFAHMEEIDLCWRVKLLGYKIYTVPQSRMYHLGGATPFGQRTA